jgi:hypothetical protein
MRLRVRSITAIRPVGLTNTEICSPAIDRQHRELPLVGEEAG